MNPAEAELAAELIRSGRIVAYPTETFYGLGTDALSSPAVENLFVLKGREPGKPIPVLVADREMLEKIALRVERRAETLIRKFWPGPLTLIFRARKTLPANLTASTGKIGARISSHPLALQLCRQAGRPVTTTSANPAGKTPPRSPAQVKRYFPAGVDLILEAGRLAGKKGSTVLDLTVHPALLIREGAIPREKLEIFIPIAKP
ncbi:MAG: L-threonylcarbamoyladenylate synthase [bacterium]|nr:L-threonylcarbamoyladenylate synthase [bacterium]